MKQFEVTLANSGKTFLVNEGENILAAALRQGVMLPYSCKNGTCGSCKGTLVAGSVHYPFHPPQALEDDEMEQGAALMCQAEPLDNLIVSVREIEAVRDIEVRMLPARVVEKDFLSESVVRLVLCLPKSQRLQFLAGFDDAATARIEADQKQGLIPDFEARPVAYELNRLNAYTLLQAFGQHPRKQPEPVREVLARIWISTLYGSEWFGNESSDLVRK